MKLKYCKIFLIYLFLSIKCFGQSGLLMSVSGKVLDVNTKLPIKNFEVILFRIENGDTVDVKFTKTDDRGIYKIRYLKAGNYEYAMQIPNVGIIYVIEENNDENYYEFTLKEGRNLNLNFFIGTSDIIDIKKEIKCDSIINVTFLYEKESTEIETGQIARSSSGCQLIKENVEQEIVNDNKDLGKAANGQPAGGKFIPSVKHLNTNFNCEKSKCKITEIKMAIGGKILLHSENWFKNTYGKDYEDNKIDGISFGECLKICMREHEERHRDDNYKYAEEKFCKAMEEINNVSAKCICDEGDREDYKIKCRAEIFNKIKQLKNNLDDYLDKQSENNANSISNPCCLKCFTKYKKKEGII